MNLVNRKINMQQSDDINKKIISVFVTDRNDSNKTYINGRVVN